jgi:hypothetical protein
VIHVNKAKPEANFTFNATNTPTYSFTDLSTGNPTAWKWDFSDTGNDSSFVQNPVYTFKTNGVHTVCLWASNTGGTSAPHCQMIVITTVGMEDDPGPGKLLVFPNPSSGNAVITLPQGNYTKLQLRCYNTMGEKVLTNHTFSGSQIELKTNGLPPGSYFFRVFDGETLIGIGKMMVR